jgi:uncharacterized membrane protein YgcG
MQRNPWAEAPRSRRRRVSPTGAAVLGPPFDFSSDQDDRVDPVEFLAIRADDEVLDGLAAGHPLGLAHDPGPEFADDQQVLALLAQLRAEIDSVGFPELVSVEQASAVIVAGSRESRPRRRLVPVAAAAALVVVALSGVTLAAGQAKPGDPLWGVSTVIDGNRAASVEAAYRVDTALADARTALAQGRVSDARATLTRVAPDLGRVSDPGQRDTLTRTSQNLIETADQVDEGQPVDTDESGAAKDPTRLHRRDPASTDPRTGRHPGEPADPSAANRPGTGTEPGHPADPGRAGGSPGAPTPVDPRLRRVDPAPAGPAAPAKPGTPTDQGGTDPGTPANPDPGTPASPDQGTPADPQPDQGSPGPDGSNPGDGRDQGGHDQGGGGQPGRGQGGGGQGGGGKTGGGSSGGTSGTRNPGHSGGGKDRGTTPGQTAHPGKPGCAPSSGGSTPANCGN